MNTRLAVLVLSSAAVLAAQSGMAFELDPELARFLQLSPSQVAAILNNDREFNATIGGRREQRLALETVLATEEAKPTPNPARLGEIEAEIERIRRDGVARRGDALRRNRSILTPAQRELLRPRIADPAVDWDLWQQAFYCGLIPFTRDNVSPSPGPYTVHYTGSPVAAAIQLYLGLSERQTGALNSISAEYRIPLARRIAAIRHAQEDLVRAKVSPTLDERVLGAIRLRLLEAYRDLETGEQVAHARRLAVLTPDQAGKLALLPTRWPGGPRVLEAAACEGLLDTSEPRVLPGELVAQAQIYAPEAIECYRAGSLDLPGFAVAFLP